MGNEKIERIPDDSRLTWAEFGGITMMEQFVMKANDWLFCVVAADLNKDMVRLNCESVCQGSIYWVGTLDQLMTEFDRL